MGSSTLIVSLILGLKEASVFAVYLIVFQGINTICSIISTAIYASFAKGQRDVLIRTFNIYEFVYYIVITILFSCTYLLIMPFIEIYTVNMTDINYIVNAVMDRPQLFFLRQHHWQGRKEICQRNV